MLSSAVYGCQGLSTSAGLRLLLTVRNPSSSKGNACPSSSSSSSVGHRQTKGRHPVVCVSAYDEEGGQNGAAPTSASSGDTEKEDLAAKLAKAEAEAEALRRELALRKSGTAKDDLSRMKPAKPERRIDGTGYRETIGFGKGRLEQQVSKWGLSETDLFSAQKEGEAGDATERLGGAALEQNADAIVRRNLLIGIGLALAAGGLSTVSIPAVIGKPSKPQFFYLVPILQLSQVLDDLLKSDADADELRRRLKGTIGNLGSVKDNLLSAAVLLEDPKARESATGLTFEILQYLDQADYDKYYDTLIPPTKAQEVEFLKFSVDAVKAASKLTSEYLKYMPSETLQAANQLLQPRFD